MADERLSSLEAEKLRLERSRACLDARFRRQEFSLRRRESDLKAREILLKEAEHNRARWQNPMTVAIAVAALGLIGNSVVTVLNGVASRKVEAQKAQDARVLEMIKVGIGDQANKNLRMLLKSGLYDDADGKLAAYLDSVQPGDEAVLPVPGAGSIVRQCAEKREVPPELIREIEASLEPEAKKWMTVAFAETDVSECSPRAPRIVE